MCGMCGAGGELCKYEINARSVSASYVTVQNFNPVANYSIQGGYQ